MTVRDLVELAARNLVVKVRHSPQRASSKLEHAFLRDARGVIHVGASYGQERELYHAFKLRVVWIEPIPEMFNELSRNISKFPEQRALNYLITEVDGKEFPFHIANNFGLSSSILDLSAHSEMWPKVTYTKTLTLTGVRLGTALERERVDITQYDALVLDTQGTECRIMAGAVELLPMFRFIKVEVPDFESYKGCCQIGEVSAFMATNGFAEDCRVALHHRPGLGTYFDVVYRRVDRQD